MLAYEKYVADVGKKHSFIGYGRIYSGLQTIQKKEHRPVYQPPINVDLGHSSENGAFQK